MNRNTLERTFQREDEEARREFIKAAMQYYQGRKFVWWLLQQTGCIGQPLFTNNALTTAFNCGQKNVGDQFLAEILEVAGEAFADMLKEMNNERLERNRRLADASSRNAADHGGDDAAGN